MAPFHPRLSGSHKRQIEPDTLAFTNAEGLLKMSTIRTMNDTPADAVLPANRDIVPKLKSYQFKICGSLKRAVHFTLS
jgi:hypothetical protein